MNDDVKLTMRLTITDCYIWVCLGLQRALLLLFKSLLHQNHAARISTSSAFSQENGAWHNYIIEEYIFNKYAPNYCDSPNEAHWNQTKEIHFIDVLTQIAFYIHKLAASLFSDVFLVGLQQLDVRFQDRSHAHVVGFELVTQGGILHVFLPVRLAQFGHPLSNQL